MFEEVYPIQLHRGGGVSVPENTLETFLDTWNRKLIPEADIRTTRDDVIVCFHDDNFQRILADAPTAQQRVSIEELSLADVQHIDAAKFRGFPCQRIPTLEAVFEAQSQSPNRFLFLDYKKIELSRLAALIRRYRIESQVIFTTCDYELICQWHSIEEKSPTMIWLPGSQEAIAAKLAELRRCGFEHLSVLQVHYHAVEEGFQLSDTFLRTTLEELNAYGIVFQVLPWLVTDSRPYEHLLELGIRSFATDYPEAIMPVYLQKFPTPPCL